MSQTTATAPTTTVPLSGYVARQIAGFVANGYTIEEAISGYRVRLYSMEARSPRVAAKLHAALTAVTPDGVIA